MLNDERRKKRIEKATKEARELMEQAVRELTRRMENTKRKERAEKLLKKQLKKK